MTNFSSYFHAVNCAALGFKPTMTVRQTGGAQENPPRRQPGAHFDLNTRPGDANIKSISVTLSSAFEIDQTHLGNICSEKELAATGCAGRQQIGKATTTTPLLDQPLTGPVYAVSGSGGLPRLAFVLNGQVNLLPRADAKTVKGGRLQTTVPVVPDAPIGHFHLVVFGGKHGYLANTRDICKHVPRVHIGYIAQSGKQRSEDVERDLRLRHSQRASQAPPALASPTGRGARAAAYPRPLREAKRPGSAGPLGVRRCLRRTPPGL